jgi:type IV pilus assembly protein PilM
MLGLNTKKAVELPIGVDLGTSNLKMAQLTNCEGGLQLLEVAEAEVPWQLRDEAAGRTEFMARTIRDMVGSGEFVGKKAVVSLPAAATFLHTVKTPVLSPEHATAAVHKEVAEHLPYPLGDAVVRHILAGEVYGDSEKHQEWIVIACARSELDGYLDLAAMAGLDLVGVNVEAVAVVACFGRLFRRAGEANRVTAFIDLGSASTQVVVMHGQELAFARNLPLGGNTLDSALAGALDVPVDQANRLHRKLLDLKPDQEAEEDLFRLLDGKISEMATEIIKCLHYHESVFTNSPIDRVIFVGGQARNARLCECIAKRLNLPAQLGDPLAGIMPGGSTAERLDRSQPQPAWAVPFGLSLAGKKAM